MKRQIKQTVGAVVLFIVVVLVMGLAGADDAKVKAQAQQVTTKEKAAKIQQEKDEAAAWQLFNLGGK